MMQLILFGFAINSDPKHLPAAVLMNDHGPQGRTLLAAIQNTGYFEMVRVLSQRGRSARGAGARRGASCHHRSRLASRATCCVATRPELLR